jgi:hypothetical protein
MTDLTDAQRVARGHRARQCLDEFVTPEFSYARQVYLARMADVAATELHPQLRADKLTTLSLAVRVLDEVERSISGVMHEGEHVRAEMIRAEKLESLTDAQQRLLRIAPY